MKFSANYCLIAVITFLFQQTVFAESKRVVFADGFEAEADNLEFKDVTWEQTVDCYQLVARSRKVVAPTGYATLPDPNNNYAMRTMSVVDEASQALTLLSKDVRFTQSFGDKIKKIKEELKEYYQCNKNGEAVPQRQQVLKNPTTPQPKPKSVQSRVEEYPYVCRVTSKGIEVTPLASIYMLSIAAQVASKNKTNILDFNERLLFKQFEALEEKTIVKPEDAKKIVLGAFLDIGGLPSKLKMTTDERQQAIQTCSHDYKSQNGLGEYFKTGQVKNASSPPGVRCRRRPGQPNNCAPSTSSPAEPTTDSDGTGE